MTTGCASINMETPDFRIADSNTAPLRNMEGRGAGTLSYFSESPEAETQATGADAMSKKPRSTVLSIALIALAGLGGQALAQQNDNSTVQVGKVNINRTAQCGDVNTNTTYQQGKININQTAQGCGRPEGRNGQGKGQGHGHPSQRADQGRGRPTHVAAGRKW